MTKPTLKSFTEQFEKMPIYGEMREFDKRLTFGQYLTVLKEWWEKTRSQKNAFENKHNDFALQGKIYDWLEKNIPNRAEKGCKYMDLLTLFIKQEVLGDP